MTLSRPTLSLDERNRRWALARKLLAEHDADCLVLAGLSGIWQFDIYLAGEHADGLVIMPMEGEPTYLTWTPVFITRHQENQRRFGMGWIEDWRLGTNGKGIVSALKDKGFERAKIAVVGLAGGDTPIEPDGWIPHGTWEHVTENLPDATFINVTAPFIDMMLKKSDEELALMRYSAQVGEESCQAMLDAVKRRANENEIVADITHVILRNGCDPTPGPFVHCGKENLSWATPIWRSQAQPPRDIFDGDIVQSELMINYGGIQTQQQLSIGVGKVAPVVHELADVARASYEAGLAAMRPGGTFGEVAEAMEIPLRESECWHSTPLIHSLSPNYLLGYLRVGMEHTPGYKKSQQIKPIPPFGGDRILEPGMALELEPNACKGGWRVNIGGAVIVTETGTEELNDLSTRMRFVD